jgi:hypothetical protein
MIDTSNPASDNKLPKTHDAEEAIKSAFSGKSGGRKSDKPSPINIPKKPITGSSISSPISPIGASGNTSSDMPPMPPKSDNNPPVVLPKGLPTKKPPLKMMMGAAVLVLMLIGAAAGLLLTSTSQDVRQQASQGTYQEQENFCSSNGGVWRNDNSCDYNANTGTSEGCQDGYHYEAEENSCVLDVQTTCAAEDLEAGESKCVNENKTAVSCVNGQISRSNCPTGYTCSGGGCVEIVVIEETRDVWMSGYHPN